MALVMLPATVDSFGIVVALPHIGSTFDVGTSALAWVVNITVLFFGSGIMVLGRLGDIFGHRRVLLYSIAAIVVGSAGTALAPNIGVMLVFRAIEGIGMSGCFATSLPIMIHAFPPEKRSVGLASWTAGLLLGNVFGAPLAGWFAQALTWRLIFWVNLPLMAAAVVIIYLAVDESRDPSVSGSVDWFGVVVPTVAILALLFALQSANALGWGSPAIIGALVASVVLMIAFLTIEPRIREPLVPFRLFRGREFWSAAGTAAAGNFSFAAPLFFTPLYLEVGLQMSPTQAGLVLLAASVPSFCLSIPAGSICNRLGPRTVMIFGMGMFVVASAVYAFASPTTGVVLVVVALVFGGVGVATAFNASNIAGMAVIPEDQAGAGSGVLSQIRVLGQVMGIAVPLLLFNVGAEQRLNDLLPGASLTHTQVVDVHGILGGSTAAARQMAHDAPAAAGHIRTLTVDALTTGLRYAMITCLVVAVAGMVAAVSSRARRGAR